MHLGRSSWQRRCKTRYSPIVGFLLPYTFLVSNRSLRFFWGLLVWMLSIGRARHPGPGTSSYPPGFSIEFLNVGGWLSRSDLALESSAHFLAMSLSIVWSLLVLVLSPLSFVKLDVLLYGHRLVRMSLLVAMRGLASSVFMVLPFLFLLFSIPPLKSSFVLVVL